MQHGNNEYGLLLVLVFLNTIEKSEWDECKLYNLQERGQKRHLAERKNEISREKKSGKQL